MYENKVLVRIWLGAEVSYFRNLLYMKKIHTTTLYHSILPKEMQLKISVDFSSKLNWAEKVRLHFKELMKNPTYLVPKSLFQLYFYINLCYINNVDHFNYSQIPR